MREPFQPDAPADDQARTFPAGSVSDTIVLLNDALMCAVPRGTTQARALERVRVDDVVPTQLLNAVLVIEPDGRLLGCVATIALLKGNTDAPIEEANLSPARVHVDDDLPEIALLMADYNLTVVPVIDRDGHLVGAISVDDLLEAVLPGDWRRRAEASQGG